jgi:hypothetical protein
MQLAKRIWAANAATRHVAVALFLGVFIAILGPFGSYPAFDQSTRYGFWIGLVLFGYFCAVIATLTIDRNLRADQLHPALRLLMVAAGSAIPTTFATAWAMSQVPSGRVVSIYELPGLFAAVACVQLIIAFVLLRLADPIKSPDDSHNPLVSGADQSDVRFMERIPAHLGNDLVAVEAVDHYLRIYTKLGSDLVHMRMADAIDELQNADGLQVHRSWWVARSAVSGHNRDGARTILTLNNGTSVPVSRTFLMAVRAANWPAARATSTPSS